MKNKKTLMALSLSCLLVSTYSQAKSSLGAYVDHDAWSLTTIDQFNADTARDVSTINVFSTFDHDWNNLTVQASNIVSRNAVPMISWMPYSSQNSESNVLLEIVDGQWDDYIASWIADFKGWQESYEGDNKPSILLRFAHEFNGNWYAWGNQPENLKAAWQYLHTKFTEAEVNDSVGWVWCANNVDVDDHSDVIKYYPGNDRVDWLSIDGYNWGSNYSFTSWKSFDETFSQQYVKMVTAIPNKPLMLAEVSSAEGHDLPDTNWGQNGDDNDANESKEAWIADMLQSIQTSYPAIKSIVWFNTNKELSWALNQAGNTGITAYNDAVIEDFFSGAMNIKSTVDASEPVGGVLTDIIDPAPKGKDKVKGNKKEQQSSRSVDSVKLTGIEKAMDVSRMPVVVGERLLEKEAEGLRNMPKEELLRWRAKEIVE
ncbi:MAG: Unknown protein [uncultured Thiotrichaceae bacterium]|uniref:GH26 domain-containing protein n=1 Tax=uncultured Thiotrichaceae bacterium TaxID=298394 RepID=A0A6S6TKP7_9GAMM|nr:MAG: Unknown protein [uncultured Thiotrichaceae bacterium]